MNDSTKEECIHEKHGYKIEEFCEYYICKHCNQWIRKNGEDLVRYKKYIDEAVNK